MYNKCLCKEGKLLNTKLDPSGAKDFLVLAEFSIKMDQSNKEKNSRHKQSKIFENMFEEQVYALLFRV